MFRRRTIKKRPGATAPSKSYPRCELGESKLFLKQFLMLKVNGEIPDSISISVMRDWLIQREMNAFEKRYKQLLKKFEKTVIQELQEEHQLQLKIKDAISPIHNCPVQSPLTTNLSSDSSSPSSSPNRKISCFTEHPKSPRMDDAELQKDVETKGRRKDVQLTAAPVIRETMSVVAKYAPSSAVKISSPPVVLKTLVKNETSPVSTGSSESVLRENVLEYPGPVAITTSQPVVMEIPSPVVPVCVSAKTTQQPSLPAHAEGREDTSPPQTIAPDSTMQGTSVSNKKKKWKRRLKDLNKKETGDVLDAFKEPPPPKPEATPSGTSEQIDPVAPPPVKVEWMRLEKEDKPNAENVLSPAPSTPTPTEQNYQYKERQWKPLNPEGRKIYDREFLLGLQFLSASKCKPEGLPHIRGVVLDKVNKTPLCQLDRRRMNCGSDFTPLFVDLDRQLVRRRGQVASLSGPDQSGFCKELRKNILSGMSVNGDTHLHRAENPWQRGGGADSDDATRELLRSVQAVLNKMTPQMFQTLMKQMEEISIDTEKRLKGVINLVFEKAVSEPNFSFIYANMCHCLMGIKVSTCDKPGVTVNFRKLLLNLCQKEFERDRYDYKTFKKREMELDAATEEELEEAKDAARRRTLGNIKFIGELFKAKVLTENIIHDCVVKLLKNHDEESLECLCILLSTIGKDLDFDKTRSRLDLYFNLMKQIIKERWTSCRIRFKLQDLIDLRQNNWVPRRGDQGPKTIKQIHKDAEMEQQREQIRVQHRLLSVKVNKTYLRPLDQSRMNCGPDFTPLFVDSDRQSVRGRGQLSAQDTNNHTHTLNGSLSGDSGAPPADSGDNVRRKPTSTPPPALSTPALSPEELEKKSTAIIEEYLNNNDMKEALQCVSEMNSVSMLCVFVRTGMELSLERSSSAREDVGSLLLQLLTAGTLTVLQYYKGLIEVLEAAEDMAVDVPYIWLYLAELITPMLREGGITMGLLFREVSKPLLPIGKAGDLLAHVLTLLCKTMSHENIGAMWREAELSWRNFLSEDEDIKKFIMEKGLHYTLDEKSGKVGISKKSLSLEEISKKLDQLLQDKSDNQRIYTWVEVNLDEQQVSSDCFVGALMRVVCQAALTGETPVKVDSTEISQRAKLLQHYIKNQQMELQALNALHSLMVQMKQPPNLLQMFLEVLYNKDIIKKDSFHKWKSNEDSAEKKQERLLYEAEYKSDSNR